MKKLQGGYARVIKEIRDRSEDCRRRNHPPVLAESNHAAVVLIPAPLVQHASVDDVSDRNVQIVSTQMLQQLQGLVPRCLTHQGKAESSRLTIT